MTITKTPEFSTLVSNLYATDPRSQASYDKNVDRLAAFINAYVVAQRRRAVDQFKAHCQLIGVKAVHAAGFEQLMRDLDRFPDGDIAEHTRNLVSDALAVDEVDDTTPEFTVDEDPDLDRLLNSTACLLSGRANQDVGLAWYDDLQVVLKRLTQTTTEQVDLIPLSSPPTDPGQVVIVVQRQGPRVLAMTFKYKKGRWCSCASGDKYTTEELVGKDWTDAGWFVSPFQPDYKEASE